MSRINTELETGGPAPLGPGRALRIGFIPEWDCAPLVFAAESGLFERYELRVELRRERRWADIRDKIIYGALDAAHAPATLPFVANLGLDSDEYATISGLVLSLQGNGILISRRLWNEGVCDAATLRDLVYRDWNKRTYTFGVPFPHSPAYFLLRQWLFSVGLAPHVELGIKAIPPEQMYPTLKLGYLDGYCSGEPWLSLSIHAQAGVCVATGADLAPRHPEKVLMVRRRFAHERADEHARLTAALIEACEFCDRPENRPLLSELLSAPRYVNAPIECLNGGTRVYAEGRMARGGEAIGAGGEILNLFHRAEANEPDNEKAAWLIAQLYETMDDRILQNTSSRRAPVLKNVFRPDLFQRGRAVLREHARKLRNEVASFEAGVKTAAR